MNSDPPRAARRKTVAWSLVAAAVTMGCPAARIDYSYEEHSALSAPDVNVTPTHAAASSAGTDGAADAGLNAVLAGGAGGAGGAGPTSSTSATGGRVFVPDTGSTSTGGMPAQADSDHDKIQGCSSQSACLPSFAQMSDDFYTRIDQAKAVCLLTALGDATPGLYLHNVTSNSSRGSDSTEHAFWVTGEGSVVHTTKRTTSGGQFALQGTAGITHTDAERCNLAGSDYFESCTRAVEAATKEPGFDDPAWMCLFDDPSARWLTSCQPTQPACS